jgi:hypothetical protein
MISTILDTILAAILLGTADATTTSNVGGAPLPPTNPK